MFTDEAVVSDLLKDLNLNGGNTTAIDKCKTKIERASLGRKQPQGGNTDIYRRLNG